MTAVGQELQIPTLASEQYPKAFGATVCLKRLLLGSGRRGTYIELIEFLSCWGLPGC